MGCHRLEVAIVLPSVLTTMAGCQLASFLPDFHTDGNLLATTTCNQMLILFLIEKSFKMT
jgi:hypothetical protein